MLGTARGHSVHPFYLANDVTHVIGITSGAGCYAMQMCGFEGVPLTHS